jgi:hypothetical protein
MSILLPAVYLGNIHYYRLLKNNPHAIIEACEHYEKQTYRNRCTIYGANGPLDLIIPVVKGKSERKNYRDARINNSENWQRIHWRSIESAYRTSPYFEFYESEFLPFYEVKKESLFEFNVELLQKVLKLLDIEVTIAFTEIYEKSHPGITDYRGSFDPHIEQNNTSDFNHYTQVFQNKHGFIPNLSVIDLLFACGPEATSYL